MDLDFLVAGQGADGLVVRFVTAGTSAEAVQLLEREGLREVELVEDETIAVARVIADREAVRAGAPALSRPDPVTAYSQRYQRVGNTLRFLTVLQRYQIWLFFGVMLAAFLLLKSWLHIVPIVVGLVVVGVALRAATFTTELLLTYEKLLQALRRGQGEVALKTLAAWEKQLDALKARFAVGSLDLVTYRARALGLAGRREEALSALEQIRGELEAPDWVYWYRRYMVHNELLEHAEGREALLKVIELGPPMALPHLDLALLCALRLRDAAQARAELERGREHPVAEAPRLALPLLEAAILLEEGDPLAARERLARARPLPSTITLVVGDLDSMVRCLVEGSLGNKTEARRRLAALEPILVGRKDQAMLARCRAAAA